MDARVGDVDAREAVREGSEEIPRSGEEGVDGPLDGREGFDEFL